MRRKLLGSACALSVFGAFHASAQTPATPSANKGLAVEEVVVTAQKRREKLQSIAVSAQTLKTSSLAQNNVSDISDLSKLVPSVSINGTTNGRVPYAMRGVTTTAAEANVGLASGVAILLDGVPVPSDSHAADQIEDIDHIEVLKGPQATLGGRTASAGVINMVTRGPRPVLTGSASTTFTTDGEQRGNFFVAGPVSDTLQFSLSGYGNHLVYPLFNQFNGTTTHADNQGVRGKLLYKPTNDLTITLTGHFAHYHSYGDNFAWVYITPGSTLLFPGSPLTIPAELGTIRPHYGNLTTNSVAPNLGAIYTDRDVSLVVDYRLGDLDITSTTALQREQQKDIQDLFVVDNFFWNVLTQGHAPPFNNTQTVREDTQQISEEVHVASPTSDRFSYLAGAFYSDTTVAARIFRNLVPAAVDTYVRPDTATYDLYGRATYKVTPQLSIIGGLRFNYDVLKYVDSQLVFAPFSPFGGSLPRYSSGSYSAGVGVGDLTAQYALTPTSNVYATYARGYAPPAYNTAAPLFNDTPERPIARMDVNHFEIGSKATYFDRRLLLNLAAFYTHYNNYQIETYASFPGLINPPLVLANAPAAQTHGVELDSTFRATEGLTLNLNAAYIDATFLNWHNAPCPAIFPGQICVQNVDGKPLPNSPKFKVTLDATQDIPLRFIDYDLVLDGTYTYRTSAEMLPDQNPHAVQGPYGLFNLSASLQSGNGRYSATVFVNNVFNKVYYTDVEDFFDTVWASPAGESATLGQPGRDARRYGGFRLTAKF